MIFVMLWLNKSVSMLKEDFEVPVTVAFLHFVHSACKIFRKRLDLRTV